MIFFFWLFIRTSILRTKNVQRLGKASESIRFANEGTPLRQSKWGAFQIVAFNPSLRGRSPKQSRRKIAITQFSGLL
ncbi:MAG: hypothetical protein LBC49_03725, partial [Bacteroidales bacterium]|nr:hypothetical protein [Bacteroidales bacterium]